MYVSCLFYSLALIYYVRGTLKVFHFMFIFNHFVLRLHYFCAPFILFQFRLLFQSVKFLLIIMQKLNTSILLALLVASSAGIIRAQDDESPDEPEQ